MTSVIKCQIQILNDIDLNLLQPEGYHKKFRKKKQKSTKRAKDDDDDDDSDLETDTSDTDQ